MRSEDAAAAAARDRGPQAAADPAFRPLKSAGRRLAEGGASALVAAYDHLLRQNDWARRKLAMFAGRRVCIGVDPPFGKLPAPRLAARVTDEGLLEVLGLGTGDEPIDVQMTLRPSIEAAFALIRSGPRGLSPHLRLEGEVMLAGALGEIAEQLRWDVEEDLSRMTGDVVARRIGRGVESARDALRELRSRIESSAGRYLAGDAGQLVGRGELESLRRALDALDARVARLASPTEEPAPPVGPPSGELPAQPAHGALPQTLPPLELPRFDFDPEGPKTDPPTRRGESN